MIADGPWNEVVAYALRKVPQGDPVPPQMAEAIRHAHGYSGFDPEPQRGNFPAWQAVKKENA